MPLTEPWLALHRTRFAELPLDCGNARDPGIIYSEDLRDWSDKATTPDQARMERYIDRFDLRASRILHIGIGNSGFAKRFHGRVQEIVGTTIDQPEIAVAEALMLPNYRVAIDNKYAGADVGFDGTFDFILDNNPTSPCCCLRHLSDMMEFYSSRIAPHGQIVTDCIGLGWIPAGANERWSFDFDDLAAIGTPVGLAAHRMTGKVYVLSKERPPKPSFRSLVAHMARRAIALPGRIARRLLQR